MAPTPPTGPELKALRSTAGIGLRELARQISRTPSTVSEMERRESLTWPTASRYLQGLQELDSANASTKPLVALAMLAASLELFREIVDTTNTSRQGADAA